MYSCSRAPRDAARHTGLRGVAPATPDPRKERVKSPASPETDGARVRPLCPAERRSGTGQSTSWPRLSSPFGRRLVGHRCAAARTPATTDTTRMTMIRQQIKMAHQSTAGTTTQSSTARKRLDLIPAPRSRPAVVVINGASFRWVRYHHPNAMPTSRQPSRNPQPHFEANPQPPA